VRDFTDFYALKAAWSSATFGPARDGDGERVIAHLHKELAELREAIALDQENTDRTARIHEELADICLLAMDLWWRSGGEDDDFCDYCAEVHSGDVRSAVEAISRYLANVVSVMGLAVSLWDVAFCALGHSMDPLERKFAELQTRTWPDWRTVPLGQPIEHVREAETHHGDRPDASRTR
jgi:hypothetical protein